MATRRERERAELRQQILAAARQLASQEGWQAVTVRKVAERIEYSHAAIYAYFDNKEAILLALLQEGFRQMSDQMQAAQDEPGTPEERLCRMVLAYWDFARINPELYQVMHGLDGVPLCAAQIAIESSAVRVRIRTGVVHVLEQFTDLAHIDVEREIDLLWATLRGLVSLAMARRQNSNQRQTALLIVSAVEHFVALWRNMCHSGSFLAAHASDDN